MITTHLWQISSLCIYVHVWQINMSSLDCIYCPLFDSIFFLFIFLAILFVLYVKDFFHRQWIKKFRKVLLIKEIIPTNPFCKFVNWTVKMLLSFACKTFCFPLIKIWNLFLVCSTATEETYFSNLVNSSLVSLYSVHVL